MSSQDVSPAARLGVWKPSRLQARPHLISRENAVFTMLTVQGAPRGAPHVPSDGFKGGGTRRRSPLNVPTSIAARTGLRATKLHHASKGLRLSSESRSDQKTGPLFWRTCWVPDLDFGVILETQQHFSGLPGAYCFREPVSSQTLGSQIRTPTRAVWLTIKTHVRGPRGLSPGPPKPSESGGPSGCTACYQQARPAETSTSVLPEGSSASACLSMRQGRVLGGEGCNHTVRPFQCPRAPKSWGSFHRDKHFGCHGNNQNCPSDVMEPTESPISLVRALVQTQPFPLSRR